MHIGVNNLPKVITQRCLSVASSMIWTHDLLIATPTLYALHYRATHIM